MAETVNADYIWVHKTDNVGSSSNASDFNSGDTQFESRMGTSAILTEIFLCFLISSRYAGMLIRIRQLPLASTSLTIQHLL
jgi:hypothetical protein